MIHKYFHISRLLLQSQCPGFQFIYLFFQFTNSIFFQMCEWELVTGTRLSEAQRTQQLSAVTSCCCCCVGWGWRSCSGRWCRWRPPPPLSCSRCRCARRYTPCPASRLWQRCVLWGRTRRRGAPGESAVKSWRPTRRGRARRCPSSQTWSSSTPI